MTQEKHSRHKVMWTKKKTVIFAGAFLLIVVLVSMVMVLVSRMSSDSVVLKIGETSIYKRKYDGYIKTAASSGVSAADAKSLLIQYYVAKDAANAVGLKVPDSQLQQVSKSVNPEWSGDLRAYALYVRAVERALRFSPYDGVDARIVSMGVDNSSVTNKVFPDESTARSLLSRAQALLNANDLKAYDALLAANSTTIITQTSMLLYDGSVVDDEGVVSTREPIVSQPAVKDYIAKCKKGDCPIQKVTMSNGDWLFFMKLYGEYKKDITISSKFSDAKNRVKVVDYEK